MISSVLSKIESFTATTSPPQEKPSKTVGDSKIVDVFKNNAASGVFFREGPIRTKKNLIQEGISCYSGALLATLSATTGATVALHEIVGHGLLGITLTQASGSQPTYEIVGWDNFQKILHADSFKEGLFAFFHWLLPFGDLGGPAGVTHHGYDKPNELGQAMGTEGRDAWISIAGSLPALALDTFTVAGGMQLRNRYPVLGNLMVGFGLMDNLSNSAYPISAAMMSERQMTADGWAGHDFARFAVNMSHITGISAHDIAISMAVIWTAFVPMVALAAYLHSKSHVGDLLPDALALRRWFEKAEKDPKIAAELDKYYQAYRQKEKLAKIKIEDLPSSPLFYDFLGYLFDKIPSETLDACKKELLDSYEKTLPKDRIQTALTAAWVAGTATALASKILCILALAYPVLQTAATALSYVSPVFIGASIISAGYQTYKDFQCPDSAVPKLAKMLSVAKLVATIGCGVLIITALFVPGLNMAFVGVLVFGAGLNILLSYKRSQVIAQEFTFQKAISPEVWNVMYPIWKNHQSEKQPMNRALKIWVDCVFKKVNLQSAAPLSHDVPESRGKIFWGENIRKVLSPCPSV